MTVRYRKARKVFEALERIIQLEDQVELDSMRLELMQDPSKTKAAEMYEAGIRLWLLEHKKAHRLNPQVNLADNEYGLE